MSFASRVLLLLIHGFDGYQPAAMREASNRSPYEELSKYCSAIKKSTSSTTSTEASSAVEFSPTATPRPPEASPKAPKLGYHLNSFSLGHSISSYH
ncbi:hypothetical protein PRIPAC_88223 [Pristionchus pacificus]|uniref:Uncharacterized protein n=1 Tax=Pristionchus pacificus TaxID=54126 RepID=A0A2A6CW77_PRIPA|nr:hypothetical protein PRIPAC_88223 [Pristionchus pacificus]|eukprot:PDM82350.1 hypothetical protein PRIPAC_36743 [Pristionchus pacificus]